MLIGEDRGARVATDVDELEQCLESSYHGALHAILVLCELFRQCDKEAFEIVRTGVCLGRQIFPWLAWSQDARGVWCLDTCDLAFAPALAGQRSSAMTALWWMPSRREWRR